MPRIPRLPFVPRLPRPARRIACAAMLAALAAGVPLTGYAQTTGTVQAPAASAPADAGVDTFPRRKAGLWEVRSAAAQGHGLAPTRYCLGDQADQARNHLDRQVGTRGACSLGAFQRAGKSWVAESVCKEGKTNVVGRAIASGDFETEYRIDTVVTYDPPLGGIKREDKEAVVAHWLGPCPSTTKAGDMIVPGMGTLNMLDGTFRAEPAPPAAAGGRRRKAAASD